MRTNRTPVSDVIVLPRTGAQAGPEVLAVGSDTDARPVDSGCRSGLQESRGSPLFAGGLLSDVQPAPTTLRGRAAGVVLAVALSAGATACSSATSTTIGDGSSAAGASSTAPLAATAPATGVPPTAPTTPATPTPTTTGAGAGTGAATDAAAATTSTAGRTPPAAGPGALRGRVILVDPGHNGGNGTHPAQITKQVFVGNGYKACNTTGTQTGAGYAEHAFTWDVANRLATLLRGAGARVVLTRSSDTGVGPCITERAAAGNRAHADLAISLHADGGPSTGVGFHVIEPGSVGSNAAIVAPSRRLGAAVRDAFRAGTGEPYATYIARNGISVRTDLGGLNLSTVPTVFIECGNMRNARDAARLTSTTWRQRAAQALATGVAAYLSEH
jgi:N-acetylmuramoyl-L-alanine amidase